MKISDLCMGEYPMSQWLAYLIEVCIEHETFERMSLLLQKTCVGIDNFKLKEFTNQFQKFNPWFRKHWEWMKLIVW